MISSILPVVQLEPSVGCTCLLQENAAHYADQIEADMLSLGLWQEAPVQPKELKFKLAFAMDTMTFPQWLQFIFLPRVREAIVGNSFPQSSGVGVQAVRLIPCFPNLTALFD